MHFFDLPNKGKFRSTALMMIQKWILQCYYPKYNFISSGKIISLDKEIKNNQVAKAVIFLEPGIPIEKYNIFLIDDLSIKGWGVVR